MAKRVRVPDGLDWRGSECTECGEAIVGSEDDTICEECIARLRELQTCDACDGTGHNQQADGTWPISKQWPETAVAQMDGRWFRLAHIGNGRYEVVDGPFGTHQRALLGGREA